LGTDIMCSTDDKPIDTGCGTLTCSSSGKASTTYGLPNDHDEPYGICQ
jgi:hypothetical protein